MNSKLLDFHISRQNFRDMLQQSLHGIDLTWMEWERETAHQKLHTLAKDLFKKEAAKSASELTRSPYADWSNTIFDIYFDAMTDKILLGDLMRQKFPELRSKENLGYIAGRMDVDYVTAQAAETVPMPVLGKFIKVFLHAYSCACAQTDMLPKDEDLIEPTILVINPQPVSLRPEQRTAEGIYEAIQEELKRAGEASERAWKRYLDCIEAAPIHRHSPHIVRDALSMGERGLQVLGLTRKEAEAVTSQAQRS